MLPPKVLAKLLWLVLSLQVILPWTRDPTLPMVCQVPVTSFPQQPSCDPAANHEDLLFKGMAYEQVIILVSITEQPIIHNQAMTIDYIRANLDTSTSCDISMCFYPVLPDLRHFRDDVTWQMNSKSKPLQMIISDYLLVMPINP